MSTDKFRFCEDVLFEAGKASEQSEVFCAVTMETPVRFEANRLKEIQGRETSVLTLRLVKQGRIGLASVSGSLDPKEVVRMAVDTSVFGAQARFEMPAHQDYPSIDVYDPGVDKVSPEQLVHLGQGMIDRVRARAPDLVCDGSVTKATVEVFVGNSKGCSARYKKSMFSAGIEGTLIRGEDMLFVGDAEVSCREITGTSGIEEQTLWQLENARELAKVKTKTMPVIFTPRGVACTLVGPLSIGFNGKTVFEGTSPLKGKLGQRLF
ncbi:MAG: TldD/PmbA family protein, partial [Chloroflexi bacterium]|nr:TldD/PmbA family protein [Chloroflexota bacterium]